MSFSHDKPPRQESKEVSDVEWEALKKDAGHYLELCKQHTSGPRSRSLKHIVFNLAASPDSVVELKEKPNRADYKLYKEGIDALRSYFQLLEDFPNFAEREMNDAEGYFPEMLNKQLCVDIVKAYEAALRGNQSK